MTPEEERQRAVDLFNRAWTLMETDERTPEQDDELIDTAHASAYHWAQVGTPRTGRGASGSCRASTTVLGRAEPALHHARRCREICEASPRRWRTGTCRTPTRRSRGPMRSPASGRGGASRGGGP